MYSRKLLMMGREDARKNVKMELQFNPDSTEKRPSNLHETYQCRMYSRKLLMMGREDARKM